jgi:UDP-N-acetylmuramoyl-L-alanyl-D-glutamate--2,6-diaminopimelate ligase
MLLREIIAQIPGIKSGGPTDVAVLGVAYDSRAVKPGYLFVAIKGEKTDGSLFVSQAVEKGARVIAADRALQPLPGVTLLQVPDARKFLAQASRAVYRDPASKLKLVAITGTNGKTTTTYLMRGIYAAAGLRSCLVGTIGNRIEDRSVPSPHTTPEASDLLAFFADAASSGCTHGVLEVSSHALFLNRVFGIKFATGVFTNLTPEHLDFHKDMESYYQAKRLLFFPENGNGLETAVINVDDEYGLRRAGELKGRLPVLRTGLNNTADIRVLESQTGVRGTDLLIETPNGPLRLRSKLVGRPNIYNMLSAIGASLSIGLDPEQIRNGIESLPGVPGRLEMVDAGQPFTVLVDYAHSPDALEKLLETVAQLPHRRIVCVFGCGGDRDRTKRPVMGRIAATMSDVAIVTSDNPRSEDPLKIIEEIRSGLTGTAEKAILPDRREAIHHAISTAREGDIVVIAGKGHEDYQLIGNQRLHFADQEVAREALEKRGDPSGAL